MENLKGRTEQEIMNAFIDKYEINIEEWKKMVLYLRNSSRTNFVIGDVVKFKYDKKTLGIVHFVHSDGDVSICYRNKKGNVKTSDVYNSALFEKVGPTKVVIANHNDRHFRIAKLENRKDTLDVLKSVNDGDYFADENTNPYVDINNFSTEEWEKFISNFTQKGMFEIIDML